MDLRNLSGIVTATPTPIRDGVVQADSVRMLARYLVESDAAAIAPIGGTGEYISLTDEQKVDMVRHTVEAVNGEVPVIAGLISAGLSDALRTAKMILPTGPDALLVITPYYVRPTQDGIVDYFKALSDELDTDLVLYEFPFRTGVSLTVETIAELVDTTRIVAMKACNPDAGLQMQVMDAVGDKISVLSGDEDVFPLHIAAGAKGGLIASSCIVPKIWNRIDALAKANRTGEALELHSAIRPFVKLLFSEHNPAPLKAALNLLGKPAGEPLLPLKKASEFTNARLAEMLPGIMALEASMQPLAGAA